MLNEVYRPRCVEDLVWSTPKLRALRQILCDLRDDARPPRILLLHGPSGCAKLTSLEILLRDVFDDAGEAQSSPDTPLDGAEAAREPSRISINAVHTRSITMDEYTRSLRSILTSMVEGTGHDSLNLKTDDHDDHHHRHRAAPRAAMDATWWATIIRFYGEGANEALHRRTSAFVQDYERLVAEMQKRGELPRLRRHVVIFMHTSHNSHNEKVDLGASFPAMVLESPAVELFRCTAITSNRLQQRLTEIAHLETERRQKLHNGSTSQPSREIMNATQERGGRGRAAKRPRKANDAAELCFSRADVGHIAESSQGDIRQALMQLQWNSLVHEVGVVEVEDAEIAALCRRLECLPLGQGCDDRPVASDLMGANEEDEAQPEPDAMEASPDVEIVEQENEEASDDSDVVFLSENSRSTPAPQRGTSTSTRSNSAAAAGPSPPSIFSLLDSMDNSSTSQQQPPTSTTRSKAQTSTPKDDAKRVMMPTSRDEFIGLPHGTAKILTQRYELHDVVNALNVPPRKLLDYLINNLPSYFVPHQLNDYAACVSCASDGDAMRAVDGLLGDSTYRRNRLADLTAEESPSLSAKTLDSMALILFDRTYRCFHTEVSIPRNFAAQRPPPFQPRAYPRLRDVPVGAPRGEVGRVSEEEWQRHVAQRLRATEETSSSHLHRKRTPLSCCEVDILREALPDLLHRCGSVDSVVEEYLPYAQFIVLDRPPLVAVSSTTQAEATGSAAPSGGAPRRTIFSFAKADHAAKPSHKRFCSELQLKLLHRGVPSEWGIRSNFFCLDAPSSPSSSRAATRTGLAAERPVEYSSGRPLIPDAEVIEEFSD